MTEMVLSRLDQGSFWLRDVNVRKFLEDSMEVEKRNVCHTAELEENLITCSYSDVFRCSDIPNAVSDRSFEVSAGQGIIFGWLLKFSSGVLGPLSNGLTELQLTTEYTAYS